MHIQTFNPKKIDLYCRKSEAFLWKTNQLHFNKKNQNSLQTNGKNLNKKAIFKGKNLKIKQTSSIENWTSRGQTRTFL